MYHVIIIKFIQFINLHDHFIRSRLSIKAFFHFESFLITLDLLENSLDRKPVPIEVIMSTS